jgi:translation initiation factor IF-2
MRILPALLPLPAAGKTTLLDALRGTSVAAREAGGITQGVAAFSVAMRAAPVAVGDRRAPGGKAAKKERGGKAAAAEEAASTAGDATAPAGGSALAAHVDVMTFLDTPGHALFSSMRQRGAALTDVVVLVVDGKDGVMPQTRECVDTIVKAGMPVVVAVTKADICPDRAAAVEAVGKQLLELGLATEDFGGDAPAVAVSAKVRGGVGQQLATGSCLRPAEAVG